MMDVFNTMVIDLTRIQKAGRQGSDISDAWFNMLRSKWGVANESRIATIKAHPNAEHLQITKEYGVQYKAAKDSFLTTLQSREKALKYIEDKLEWVI